MAEVATKGQVIVRHRDEGEAIWAVGSLFMVKLAVEESGGFRTEVLRDRMTRASA